MVAWLRWLEKCFVGVSAQRCDLAGLFELACCGCRAGDRAATPEGLLTVY